MRLRTLGMTAGLVAGFLSTTIGASGVEPRQVTSPESTVSASARTATVNGRIDAVLRTRSKSKVLGKRFTMTVWDTNSQSYVFQKRSHASLRGASTTKVLTGVAALETLGPDYRMPTLVRAGNASGEIVLVGGGDPLLTSSDLAQLAADTAEALGVAQSASETPSADPSASGAAASPNASAAPVTLETPSASPPASESATSTPTPTPAAPKVVVRADDSLFGDQGKSSRGWPSYYLPREVRPVSAFARDDRKVLDSTSDAARFFAKELRKSGVSATYSGEATADPASVVIAAFPGHRVADAVSRALLISDNDTAEMLFRQVAVARGIPATWAGSRKAVRAALADLNIPLAGVRVIDGSGLSLQGRLTSGALTSALNRALSAEHPRLAGLRIWLPVAGRSGTLKSQYQRFNNAPAKCAAGHIQAKTGTVADSISLAGYADGADGQTKIFVSIVNSRPTRWSRQVTRQQVDRVASSVTGCW